MAEKYLTQLDLGGTDGIYTIRDPKIWEYVTQFGGALEVVVVTTLPDPNATIPAGLDGEGEKYGEYYRQKLVLSNKADTGTGNSYDEYIIIREDTETTGVYDYRWEKIGTTDLNMAGYSSKGHVHAVATNVSVDDHTFTPDGTVTVELNYEDTQAVAITGTPKGTVKLEETTQADYNGEGNTHNILQYTPAGSITGNTAEAGSHSHTIGRTKRVMKRTTLSVSATTTDKYLDKENVELFTLPTVEADKLKASKVYGTSNKAVARVTGSYNNVPTVDDTKVADFTETITKTTNGTVTDIQKAKTENGTTTYESATPLVEAVATKHNDAKDYYTLSFTKGVVQKADLIIGVSHGWDHGENETDYKPLKKSAFGIQSINKAENYEDQLPFHTFTDVEVPKPVGQWANLTADDFEKGSLLKSGDTTNSATYIDIRIRTKEYIESPRLYVKFSAIEGATWGYRACGYNDAGNCVGYVDYANGTESGYVAVSGATKYKLALMKNASGEEANIEPSDFEASGITVYKADPALDLVKGLKGQDGENDDKVVTGVALSGNTTNNVLTYGYEILDAIHIYGESGTGNYNLDVNMTENGHPTLAEVEYEYDAYNISNNDLVYFLGFGNTYSQLRLYGLPTNRTQDGISVTVRQVTQAYRGLSVNNNANRFSSRTTIDGGSTWTNWNEKAERDPGNDASWNFRVKNDGIYNAFVGKIYRMRFFEYNDTTQETISLLHEFVPAKSALGNYGLYDLVTGDFKDLGSENIEGVGARDGTDVPFVDDVDGVTGSVAGHTHGSTGLGFSGNPKYIKATFNGTSNESDSSGTKLAGTTAKAAVQSATFTGTKATIAHTVHNPTVITGSDTYDEGLHLNDWYGVMYDETVADPQKTRIGNTTMHKTLPIQSGMRRCLLKDDGTVYNYLDPDDSTKYAAGSTDVAGNDIGGQASELSGTAYSTYGDTTSTPFNVQVMVEIPHHWRLVTRNDTTNVVTALVSPYHQQGWTEVKQSYISAYEAYMNTSGTTKLWSVSDIKPRGENIPIWSEEDGKTVFTCDMADATGYSSLPEVHSLLPTVELSIAQFRDKARARGDVRWNAMVYDLYLAVYWLYVIEYANTDSQKAFEETLTVDGFKQGGLGKGCTTVSVDNWQIYGGGSASSGKYYPFVPCGATNILGDKSGEVMMKLPSVLGGGTVAVPSYRGLENIFGHLWTMADGIEYRGNGTNQEVWRCADPADYSSAGNGTGYANTGTNGGNNGYKTKIMVGTDGDINCAATGGSNSTYYCDYNYKAQENNKWYVCLLGGSANVGTNGGLAYVISNNLVANSRSNFGSRLCFYEN